MNCPKCNEGIIMVTAGVCTCGHHMLVCNKCFSIFGVECGPPFGPEKLPPDFPIVFNEQMTRIAKEDVEESGVILPDAFGILFTVEDFKAKGCQWPKTETKKKIKLAVFIATWFYSGLIPPFSLKGMAGTYGSFFSIPLVFGALWMANNIWSGIYLAIFMTIYFLGLKFVPKAEIELGPRADWHGKIKSRDQNQIVIDETWGMLTTFYPFVPHHQPIWLVLLVGFILFRIFDIIKIPPTGYFDRKKSAAGVMMDDFVAGIYALICMQILIIFFNL